MIRVLVSPFGLATWLLILLSLAMTLFSLYLVAKAEQWYGVDENPLTSFSNAVWHTFGSFLGENVFQGNIPGGAIASRSVKQNSNHKSCTGHEKT